MKTISMQPIHVYAPIERVDDEQRTISAYAFRNEVVDGEGGVRLRRSAMEAATPDYMQWANIRRMHQLDAVGVADSVVWDEKGALMTLRVVDDDAWNKVKSGVYKGLSVGVRPKVARGNEVTVCQWFETSLVDRPKDTDCTIPLVRAEGVDPAAEVEVEVLEDEQRAEEVPAETETAPPAEEIVPEAEQEPEARAETITLPADWSVEDVADFRSEWEKVRSEEGEARFARILYSALLSRGQTSDTVPSRENLEGGIKSDMHYSCGSEYGCHGHTTRGGAQECMEREAQGLDEHIAHVQEHLDGLKAKKRAEDGAEIERTEDVAPLPDPATAPPNDLLERVSSIAPDQLTSFTSTILTRLEAAESGLAEERRAHLATTERAETLARQPLVRAPVRYPAALARTFSANADAPPDVTKLREELKRVEAEGIAAAQAQDAKGQNAAFFRVQELKTAIQFLSNGEA